MQNPTTVKGVRALARTVFLSLAFTMGATAQPATDAYPSKPVKVMVGYGPGGTGDLTVRLVAQKLSEKTGQQFIVDNRPGAGGIVASQVAQQSAPDGYTLNLDPWRRSALIEFDAPMRLAAS